VLACGDRGAGDLDVHGGDGEVHDEVDAGVGQDVLGRAEGGHAVLLGLRLGAVDQQVAHDEHLGVGERREVLQVGVADDSDADDADADRAHRAKPPSMRNE